MAQEDLAPDVLVDAKLSYVPEHEIWRVSRTVGDRFLKCKILSDMFRLNTLYMIMNAGSGHIGSSFSAMDIVTWLWSYEMISPNNPAPQIVSDTYFSSKGHDAPGLYSVLMGLGRLDFELIHKLRRIDGLPGHPDVSTPGIAANTGSLGMGVAKACGMVLGNKFKNKGGTVYVMTGDGELQEGQIWESLQPVANWKLGSVVAIVDHNKMQSDSKVSKVSDLGDIEKKFKAFGWEVARCDGHDFEALGKVFAYFRGIYDRPKVLIADTIKGKGVSFMHGVACGDETYKFHAGAPSVSDYLKAVGELTARINNLLAEGGVAPVVFFTNPMPKRMAPQGAERLVEAYGDELLKIARGRDDIVVMDADLMSDCGIVKFKEEFPERFIECGIAEQHMVSTAGGLALKGMIPIVHSFECFLTTRANEQIYNNATEKKKIVYVGTLAGLLPAGPGHSHQSVRGISAIGSIPGLVAFEPSCERESRLAIRWAIEENKTSTYLRFVNIPSVLSYKLPEDYKLSVGQGVCLREGSDAAILAYGSVMLNEAFKAADMWEVDENRLRVAVYNFPWLNRIDEKWLIKELGKYPLLITLDNHYTALGLGMQIGSVFAKYECNGPKVVNLGVEDVPACGRNDEVLKYHGLDAHAIADRIGLEVFGY